MIYFAISNEASRAQTDQRLHLELQCLSYDNQDQIMSNEYHNVLTSDDKLQKHLRENSHSRSKSNNSRTHRNGSKKGQFNKISAIHFNSLKLTDRLAFNTAWSPYSLNPRNNISHTFSPKSGNTSKKKLGLTNGLHFKY